MKIFSTIILLAIFLTIGMEMGSRIVTWAKSTEANRYHHSPADGFPVHDSFDFDYWYSKSESCNLMPLIEVAGNDLTTDFHNSPVQVFPEIPVPPPDKESIILKNS